MNSDPAAVDTVDVPVVKPIEVRDKLNNLRL
jgi:hypothetical protein